MQAPETGEQRPTTYSELGEPWGWGEQGGDLTLVSTDSHVNLTCCPRRVAAGLHRVRGARQEQGKAEGSGEVTGHLWKD